MSHLFTPLRLRELDIPNRVFLPPMCQYSASDGLAGSWHLVHYGTRAVGGAGLLMVEATAVAPEGRISPADLGLWSDAHATALAPIAAFVREHGAVPAIQLAHAGRKASCALPWQGGRQLAPGAGGWETLAPSPVAFAEGERAPREMTHDDMARVTAEFAAAARRAHAAGFQVVEIHMAHGYLLHEFLSPLSNQRRDAYGGTLENRLRFPLEVARAVRAAWPGEWPVFVRISATDWAEGGWDVAQSVALAKALKAIGVDFMDVSSAGLLPDAIPPAAPGFQTPFAAAIRHEAGLPTGAVGLITAPAQAEHVLVTGQADAVFIGRELLRNPYWPRMAARQLGDEAAWPRQYQRAR